MQVTCAACGALNPTAHRYCTQCGAALALQTDGLQDERTRSLHADGRAAGEAEAAAASVSGVAPSRGGDGEAPRRGLAAISRRMPSLSRSAGAGGGARAFPPSAGSGAAALFAQVLERFDRAVAGLAPSRLLIAGAALIAFAQFIFWSPDVSQPDPPALGRFALIAGMLAFALGSFLYTRGPGTDANAAGASAASGQGEGASATGESANAAGGQGESASVAGESAGGRDGDAGAASLPVERRSDLRLWAWGAGAALTLYLAARLLRGSTAGSDVTPWLIAIAAFGVPLLPRDAMGRASAAFRAIRVDALIVAGIAGAFIALNARDITHWHYSYIGDEFEFWNFARNINLYGLARPFSQDGVYGFNPVLSLAGKAAVMRVFGNNDFGATLSSALTAAAAIPGVYLTAYLAGRGRTAAIVAASLFASSHYLFALSHISYNNLDALLPMTYAAGFFLLGVRRNSPFWLYAAGAAAGMGFYTHLAARATMPILIVALALSPALLARSRPLFAGFAVAAFPAFIVNGAQAFAWLFPQLAGGYSEAISGPFLERVQDNVRNLFAFHYNTHHSHYVTGSLMDALSGGAAALGVGYALGTIRERSSRLLLVWIAALFVFAGLLSPHPHVPNTRMFLLMPPLAVAGGVVAGRYAWFAAARIAQGKPHETLAWALVGALLLSAFALNVRQFWVVSPPLTPLTNEAIATGAWREECGSDLTATAFVSPNLHMQALRRYDPEGPEVRILLASDVDAGAPLPDPDALRCVIAVPAGAPEMRALADDLQARYPDVEPLTIARLNGEVVVYRFRS